MARAPRARGAGRLGCLLAILLVVGVSLAAWGFEKGMDRFMFPWAFDRGGRPTLTGVWVGTLATGGGERQGMLVELWLKENQNRRGVGARYSRNPHVLEGELTTCTPTAREVRYTLDGNVPGRSGERWVVHAKPDSGSPDGLAPSWIRGEWNRRDSLRAEADVHLRRGASAISMGDDPHTSRPAAIGLGRGDSTRFAALCARLGARR